MARAVEQALAMNARTGLTAPGQFRENLIRVPTGSTLTRLVGRVCARNNAGLLQGISTPVRVAIYPANTFIVNLDSATLTANFRRIKFATTLYPSVLTPTDQAGSVGDFPRSGFDAAEFDVRGDYISSGVEDIWVHWQVPSGQGATPGWAVAYYFRAFFLLP